MTQKQLITTPTGSPKRATAAPGWQIFACLQATAMQREGASVNSTIITTLLGSTAKTGWKIPSKAIPWNMIRSKKHTGSVLCHDPMSRKYTNVGGNNRGANTTIAATGTLYRIMFLNKLSISEPKLSISTPFFSSCLTILRFNEEVVYNGTR